MTIDLPQIYKIMNPMALAGMGISTIGAIGGLISNISASNKLDNLLKQDPTYHASPYASQRLGLAQTLLNARMPGAAAMSQNIYGNEANQLANVHRNATDSTQALALGSAAQGQTNQAFAGLATQEQQDYYNRLQNFTGAQQGMISEGDKVYQDQIRRYQDQAAIAGAKLQNRQTAWNSLANFGTAAVGAASQLKAPGGGNPGMQDPNYPSSRSAASMGYMGMTPMGAQQQMAVGSGYMPSQIYPGQNAGMMNSAYPGMPQAQQMQGVFPNY
jgi:hypothetical protein